MSEETAGPSTAEAEYETFVWDNLRRNYAANYVHGMLGMTGFRLVSAPTFIPAYIQFLGGSPFIIGLGTALQQLGGVVSPVAGAAHVEHREKLMPTAVLLGTLMRLPLLVIAITGWLMHGPPLLFVMILMLFFWGLFSGSQRVVFQLLMAKVIPISRRGQLQAWRNLTGGLIAAALSYVAGRYLIQQNVWGNGYATTFLIAFLLTSAGLTVLQLLMREPVSPHRPAPSGFRQRMKDVPALLAADRDYRNFLLAQLLTMAARMAAPFYIGFAGGIVPMTGTTFAHLTTAFLLADTVSNLLWGYLGDRGGFRSSFVIALVLWIGSTALLIFSHGEPALIAAFFGLGAAQSGYNMSSTTMVLEFGAKAEVAMRLGISSTVEGLMSSLGPLLGGILVKYVHHLPVFLLAMALQAVALVVLLLAVKEPRLRQIG